MRKPSLRDFIHFSKVTHLVITCILTLSELLLTVIEYLTMSMHYAKFLMYINHLFILVIYYAGIKNLLM